MKKIYYWTFFIYFLTVLYASISFCSINAFVSWVLLCGVFILKYDQHKIFFLIYVYLSQVLGSLYHFYDFPYYDKAIHFLSGLLFVLLAYLWLKNQIHDRRLLWTMINCVEMACAFLWEVFEYCGLLFFNYDAIHHWSSGVHDTMQDMIISLAAGLLMSVIIHKFSNYIDGLYKSRQDIFYRFFQ